MTDNNGDNDTFRPPSASRATRTIAKRSRHKSSGAVVLQLPGCSEPRIIQYDSMLELRALNLYAAMADIWDIWEQPRPIVYRDRTGTVRRHYFDFLVTFTSGRSLALAVKPLKRVLRSGFLQELRCIRQQVTKEIADDVVLVTDRDFTRAEALNAERYLAFRSCWDQTTRTRVQKAAQEVGLPCTVRAVVENLGGGSKAYRSVFVAIYQNVFSADRTQLIDLHTMLGTGEDQ